MSGVCLSCGCEDIPDFGCECGRERIPLKAREADKHPTPCPECGRTDCGRWRTGTCRNATPAPVRKRGRSA